MNEKIKKFFCTQECRILIYSTINDLVSFYQDTTLDSFKKGNNKTDAFGSDLESQLLAIQVDGRASPCQERPDGQRAGTSPSSPSNRQ